MSSSFKEKALLIVWTGIMLLAVLNWTTLYSMLQLILGSMNAIFIGAILAFILNVPMKKLENQFEKHKWTAERKRPLAIAGVLIVFSLIVAGLLIIVVPTLIQTVSELVTVSSQATPKIIATITSFLESTGLLSGKIGEQITTFLGQFKDFTLISNVVSPILSGLVSNVTGIFANTFSLIMAFFFTLAILGSKEHLQSMTNRLMQATLPKKAVDLMSYTGSVIVDTYDRFLMSQIVEAVIIGVLVFVSYSLTGIPYASMAGVLSGVLSFVPYIGPLTASMISALFVAVHNPLLALWSIILFQLIQLIEGNVIYPRVVGQSVGLPTLFTLAAALIGGNLFGLLGMIFFTPIFAVIYRLVKEWVDYRLKEAERE